MEILVVSWDGGSNRQPFEVLTAALTARGDNVLVISHEAHRSVYEGAGATFQPLPMGDRVTGHRRRSDAEDMERVVGIWLSPEIAHDVRAALASRPIGVAIVDVTMLTAISACEAAGTPLVLVHHTLPGAYWAGGRVGRLAGYVEPLNRVRGELGLAPACTYGELIAHAKAHIVPTSAALDRPIQWPVPLHYVGPLQPARATDDVIDLPERFVLVSFSTTWQRQVEAVQRVIDALAGLDRPVVLTTGPSLDPAELAPAGNTIVVADIPHLRVLDRVDLVVTHAGHGTVLSALTAGVPLLCMPMGRDQHDISARVAEVGAGVVLGADAPGDHILNAARRVLDEPAFGAAARRLADSIAGEVGVDGALAVVDRVAGVSRGR